MANEVPNGLEAMLGDLMRDPARMAQLTRMAASLGITLPDGEAKTESEPTAKAASDPDVPPALPASLPLDPATVAGLSGLLPLVSGKRDGKQKPDHRTALLLALKPYLSENRCAMIDAIVNFGRLGNILGRTKEE